MPLQSGDSRAVVGANIKREEEAGKPKKQAVAIALHKAQEGARKLREAMFPHLRRRK